MADDRGVLVLLVTAARPLRWLSHGLDLLRQHRVDVHVGASESALGWLEPGFVEERTGNPLLNAGGPLPTGRPPVVVAPASFGTLNKLAAGIADTLPCAVAAEAIGAGRRVVVAPSMNSDLLAHPVVGESRQRLTSYGVELLWPAEGNEDVEDFHDWWDAVVATVTR